MRIAIVGAGSVGGFVGGALARAGHPVALLVRPGGERLSTATLHISSRLLGDFDAPVDVIDRLAPDFDVVFVTVRTFQLEATLATLATADIGDAIVVPLMNGIDHVGMLRARFGADRVVAGTIRVEAERVSPDRIRQLTPFADVQLGPSAAGADRRRALDAAFRAAGFTCGLVNDESTALWTKLAMLAPLALATSAADLDIGGVRNEPGWNARLIACCTEACAVARADGAAVATERVLATLAGLPDGMRSSMQKDLEAGRPLETDAIGGAVSRHGEANGLPTPATVELLAIVAARAEVVRHSLAAGTPARA
jgi:2-dehydropantoate 2-reductase